jgi:DNA-binding response OmpR family regulator
MLPPKRSEGTTTTRRVLVVDDNEAVRESIAEILRLGGYEVSEAQDVAQAANEVAGSGAHLVLLDLGLDHGGLNLLEELDSTVPVILMSGSRDTPISDPRIAAFLSKPILPDRLLEEVALHMRSSE